MVHFGICAVRNPTGYIHMLHAFRAEIAKMGLIPPTVAMCLRYGKTIIPTVFLCCPTNRTG